MLRCCLFWLALCLIGCGLPAAGQAAGLALEPGATSVPAWPAVSVAVEPDGLASAGSSTLVPEDWLRDQARFEPPRGAAGTLGLQRQAVWLRLPLEVAPTPDPRWVLEIDYPPLNRIDAWIEREGRLQALGTLGNLLPFSQRPLASRAHALPLLLPPGEAVLYLRVQSHGGLVLPITLSRPAAFHARALAEQTLQGLLAGLTLAIWVYSLMQWIALREPLYGKYALLIGASGLFSVFQLGLGAQYLWTDNVWIEQHVGAMAALLAASGTALFVEQALGPHRRRWFGPLMKGIAVALWLTAAAHALDWLTVHQVSRVVGTLGLAPALLGLPGALARARRGEAVGWIFLVAWLGYFVSTAVMVGLITGRVEAGFWSLHSFQFGHSLDMLLFLRILGLRAQALKQEAEEARTEQRRLQDLAHTDALTGLANRRGLVQALEAALPAALHPAARGGGLGLFVLDLDGFKQVNDRHGHETGDAVLQALAQRLAARVRAGSDTAARLGGDEFVVLAPGVCGDAEARVVAEHLRAAFAEPVLLPDGHQARVGASIGWALAPRDGQEPTALLRHADAAMYAGKAAGRGAG